MISQIEKDVDLSVFYEDLVPGDLFALDDNGTIFMKSTDLSAINLQTGRISPASPFRVLPIPDGAEFVYHSNREPNTFDKTEPNLSNVSDKPTLSVEALVDFVRWLDASPDVSFYCMDGPVAKVVRMYLSERNNSRKVPENDTFRK